MERIEKLGISIALIALFVILYVLLPAPVVMICAFGVALSAYDIWSNADPFNTTVRSYWRPSKWLCVAGKVLGSILLISFFYVLYHKVSYDIYGLTALCILFFPFDVT